MNANDSLERGIADVYEREAPPRAPDWVLASILDAIDETPQRRGLIPAPWRFRHMNTFAKAAIAVVAVVAIGALGWSVLGPRSPSGVGGTPSATPSASAAPSPSASRSPDPSAPPPLAGAFTSSLYGFSMSYPRGWVTTPASQLWTSSFALDLMSPAADRMNDPVLTGDLWFAVASQPLSGKAGDTWVTDLLGQPGEGCSTTTEPITVDGATGRMCENLAAFWIQDRGYFIRLYTSGDQRWLGRNYDLAWFRTVLETVQLHPENAVDTAPSPSA
jgi:hypothetical protein